MIFPERAAGKGRWQGLRPVAAREGDFRVFLCKEREF